LIGWSVGVKVVLDLLHDLGHGQSMLAGQAAGLSSSRQLSWSISYALILKSLQRLYTYRMLSACSNTALTDQVIAIRSRHWRGRFLASWMI